MNGQQAEMDFSVVEGAGSLSVATADSTTPASRRSGNRRLKVIATSSIILATLTTGALVHLHASPAPAEPQIELSSRPIFADIQRSNQVFVAPKLSAIRESSRPVAQDTNTPVAQLSMPLSGPNSQWKVPGDVGLEVVTRPSASAKPDLLMVDLPAPDSKPPQEQGIVHARRHDPHGLSLAAGSIIECALETAIDSSRGGYVTCVVTDDVVSDDARAVLIERGTHVLGEYHADARLGDARIGIIWNRLRKSDGTTVDLASPGTDQQGRSGISGAVDNHWFTRIGAAVLLSVVEDGISAASAPKANGTTLVFGNTAATGSTLSQKVLDASINLPPTITINPGARISILVAKDIDFQSAYANR